MFNAGIASASRFGGWYLRMLPPGLVERITPPPGTGHDEGSRGHYKVETYTTTSTGARYKATMSQKGDPGYKATSVLLGESGLALALDRDRLSVKRSSHGLLAKRRCLRAGRCGWRRWLELTWPRQELAAEARWVILPGPVNAR